MNPAAGLDRSAIEQLMGGAGTFMVTASLSGCTFQEKALISVMIPSLLKIIRTVPKAEREAVMVKLWPPDDDTSRATATTNQTPTEPPKH